MYPKSDFKKEGRSDWFFRIHLLPRPVGRKTGEKSRTAAEVGPSQDARCLVTTNLNWDDFGTKTGIIFMTGQGWLGHGSGAGPRGLGDSEPMTGKTV